MDHHLRTLPLIGLLALLDGCGGKPAAPPKPPPAEVGVMAVQPRQVELTTSLPGRTNAFLIADVRPQVSGLITRRDFTEGSEVKQGQQLYQIDPAPYQATYDSSIATLAHDQAALVTAEAKSARYKPLAAAQAVSQQDFDDARAATNEARADIGSAKANVEQARINLAYTKVEAPIAGRIGRSSVTPGALVTSGQATALATITQLDPIYVDVEQPATTFLRLKREFAAGKLQTSGPNQAAVMLKLEDGSDYPLAGSLQFSEVNVDTGSGTVLLRAVFRNPDHLLLPGMFVTEQLKEGVDQQALLVPQPAVSRDPHGDPTVFVLDAQNKVSSRKIETSRAIGADWLVSNGLAAGDRIVVDGLLKVHPGDTVKPVDPGTKPDAGGPPGAAGSSGQDGQAPPPADDKSSSGG